jgi:hypothetical protein
MASSRLVRRVALVRTDVSEERSASFIRVTRVGAEEAILQNNYRLFCSEIAVPL